MRTVLTILAILFVLVVPGLGAQAPPAPVLDLRINPLMDLHYWVRKLAREESALPAVEGLPAAVAATNQAGLSLGDPRLWGVLDASFTEASSSEELAHVATQVPESFKTRDGRSIPVRQSLVGLAKGYQGVEKGFFATIWPSHRDTAERAAAAVRKVLFPKATEVYADLSSRLGLPAPGAPIPMYLVGAAPFPGAFTLRSHEGPFSVVALEGEPDSQWVEIVVH
ncbi:MAG TPA: hypothetical protein VGS07_00295 [Thermoanaerobaculia bacterium]|jgi:hypothetical protein|nr:hypothetical protein [Thermoanaerobaculia bacterium]